MRAVLLLAIALIAILIFGLFWKRSLTIKYSEMAEIHAVLRNEVPSYYRKHQQYPDTLDELFESEMLKRVELYLPDISFETDGAEAVIEWKVSTCEVEFIHFNKGGVVEDSL